VKLRGVQNFSTLNIKFTDYTLKMYPRPTNTSANTARAVILIILLSFRLRDHLLAFLNVAAFRKEKR
jgi:hypothetical protein